MWTGRVRIQRAALLLWPALSLLAATAPADDVAPAGAPSRTPAVTPGVRKVITGTIVAPGSGAPGQPEGGRRTVTILNQNGVLQVMDLDGTFQRHVRIPANLPHDVLLKRLKELQESAGDPDAVKRITDELLRDMQAQSPPGQPKFGLGISLMREFPPALRAQLKLEGEDGLLVQSIAENSPAGQAGIREYDVILEINGHRVQQPADLVDAVQRAGEAGKPVSLLVISGGERKTVDVTPTASTQITWTSNVDAFGPDEDRIIFRAVPGAAPQFQVHTLPPGVTPGQPGVGIPPMATSHAYSIYPPTPSLTPPAPMVQVVESPGTIRKLEQRIQELEERLQRLTEQLEKIEQKR